VIGDAWLKVIKGRGFLTPEGNTIFYSVGQPMGAYSSWSSFSLSHHLIVQYSAYKVGFTHLFEDYRILGDDLVIRNTRVAESYVKVMKELGVSINMDKS